MLTCYPLSISVPDTLDRPGTPASDERFTPVQDKPVVIQRLRCVMKRAGHKQTAKKRRYEVDVDWKTRFQMEGQPCNQVYIDCLPREVQHTESIMTYLLTEYSEISEENILDGSRKLLPRRTGPYKVRSVTGSAVTIDRDGVAIPVSIDRVTKMYRVLSNTEPTAKIHNSTGQSEAVIQKNAEENSSPPANPDDPEPAAYATDRIAGHRGTGDKTEYKVRWYEYGAEEETYEPAYALPTKSVRH